MIRNKAQILDYLVKKLKSSCPDVEEAARVTDEGLVITDLDSRTGTFINEQKVQKAAVRDGDVIKASHHRQGHLLVEIGTHLPLSLLFLLL